MIFALMTVVALASPVESRGPALSIEPAALGFGGRFSLGPASRLDLRPGAIVEWSNEDTTTEVDVGAGGTLEESKGARRFETGFGLTVAPRVALGAAGSTTGWWFFDLTGDFKSAMGGVDAFNPEGREIGVEETNDWDVVARLGTGPGVELAVGSRWTLGLDASLGIASYALESDKGVDDRLGFPRTRRTATFETGLPTNVALRILLTRYRDPLAPEG